MTPIVRQRLLLGMLGATLAAVGWWQWSAADAGRATGRTTSARPSSATGKVAQSPAVPGVELSRLGGDPVEPVDLGRDPFRFGRGARRAAADEPVDLTPTGARRPVALPPPPALPAGPPPPPPLPPIPLKFIGVVQQQGEAGRIAVLSDARGVYHGREGDVIEGRYRIIRIAAESVELAYVDGRGRQLIRLSGS